MIRLKKNRNGSESMTANVSYYTNSESESKNVGFLNEMPKKGSIGRKKMNLGRSGSSALIFPEVQVKK